MCDDKLANDQFNLRQANHPFEEKSKVKGGKPATKTDVWPGALVFLKKDKSKLRARETYIVVKVEDNFCFVKKLKNVKFCPHSKGPAPATPIGFSASFV